MKQQYSVCAGKVGKTSGVLLWGCLGFRVCSDAQLSPISGCAALETNINFNKPCNGGSSAFLKGLSVSAVVNVIW